MKKNVFGYLFIFLFVGFHTFAQSIDEQAFKQKMALTKAPNKAQTALLIAKSFIENPYVGGTLDRNTSEQLVCNLKEFDCWTFVENVAALTETKFSATTSFEAYKNNLQNLRYRNGQVKGYGSRLHYFLEWIMQAQKNDIIKDMTPQLGGKIYEKEIDFMTKHRDLYPKLKDNVAFQEVAMAQDDINSQQFYYIPKAMVAKIESQIKDGDIIGITSSVEGLDFNHEGFAIRQNGRIHLLHASAEQKKVVISSESLSDYLARIKKHSGIMVLRFN